MLTEDDREEISRGIAEQAEGRVIAERIGRDPSVVSREVARHGGRTRYRAVVAARAAAVSRCRPKTRKLDADPDLRERVLGKLRAGCSPDQVAGRLRHEHAGAQAERVADTVSREAIYTWIYALPKGELAKQGIVLRSGRTRRRPRGRRSSPGARIVGMTSIDARPTEVDDRAVPGASTLPEDEERCDPGRVAILQQTHCQRYEVMRAEEVRLALRATLRSVMDSYDLLAMATVPIDPFEANAIGSGLGGRAGRSAALVRVGRWPPIRSTRLLSVQCDRPAGSVPSGGCHPFGAPGGTPVDGSRRADDLGPFHRSPHRGEARPLPAAPDRVTERIL